MWSRTHLVPLTEAEATALNKMGLGDYVTCLRHIADFIENDEFFGDLCDLAASDGIVRMGLNFMMSTTPSKRKCILLDYVASVEMNASAPRNI